MGIKYIGQSNIVTMKHERYSRPESSKVLFYKCGNKIMLKNYSGDSYNMTRVKPTLISREDYDNLPDTPILRAEGALKFMGWY